VSVILSTAHTAAELFTRRHNLAPGSEKALRPYLYLLYLLLVQCMYIILIFYVPCMIQNYKFILPHLHAPKYTHQTLVNFIHVSTSYGCHHQGALSLANVAPQNKSVNTTTHLHTHYNFQLKHQNGH